MFGSIYIYIYIHAHQTKEHTKRTYAAALRTNRPSEQQNQIKTKNQQHNEVSNNHNHHTRNAAYTSSNINTINRQEEEPKKLKHASIQPNEGRNSDQILEERVHKMQQVTMAAKKT